MLSMLFRQTKQCLNANKSPAVLLCASTAYPAYSPQTNRKQVSRHYRLPPPAGGAWLNAVQHVLNAVQHVFLAVQHVFLAVQQVFLAVQQVFLAVQQVFSAVQHVFFG